MKLKWLSKKEELHTCSPTTKDKLVTLQEITKEKGTLSIPTPINTVATTSTEKELAWENTSTPTEIGTKEPFNATKNMELDDSSPKIKDSTMVYNHIFRSMGKRNQTW